MSIILEEVDDFLEIDETLTSDILQSPTTPVTFKYYKNTINVDSIIISPIDSGHAYKIIKLGTYKFILSSSELIKFKDYLNYYRDEGFHIFDGMKHYIGYLLTDNINNERALDLYNTDIHFILQFEMIESL
jgi:hypothetical protein